MRGKIVGEEWMKNTGNPQEYRIRRICSDAQSFSCNFGNKIFYWSGCIAIHPIGYGANHNSPQQNINSPRRINSNRHRKPLEQSFGDLKAPPQKESKNYIIGRIVRAN